MAEVRPEITEEDGLASFVTCWAELSSFCNLRPNLDCQQKFLRTTFPNNRRKKHNVTKKCVEYGKTFGNTSLLAIMNSKSMQSVILHRMEH